MVDVGDRFIMDLEGCGPEVGCRGRVVRAALERVLFECWSSVANLVRCVALYLSGDLRPTPLSLVEVLTRDAVLGICLRILLPVRDI